MNWNLIASLVLISIPVVLFGLLVHRQPQHIGFKGRVRFAFEDLVRDTTAWGSGLLFLAVLLLINAFFV